MRTRYTGSRNTVPDTAYAHWSLLNDGHDYTYGLSRASLRPVVEDEAYPLLSLVQSGGVSRNQSQWRGMRAESA